MLAEAGWPRTWMYSMGVSSSSSFLTENLVAGKVLGTIVYRVLLRALVILILETVTFCEQCQLLQCLYGMRSVSRRF